MHVARAERTDKTYAVSDPNRENYEHGATLAVSSDSQEPLFASEMPQVGSDSRILKEEGFNFGKRQAVFLALVPIAGIPIEAVGCDAHPRI